MGLSEYKRGEGVRACRKAWKDAVEAVERTDQEAVAELVGVFSSIPDGPDKVSRHKAWMQDKELLELDRSATDIWKDLVSLPLEGPPEAPRELAEQYLGAREAWRARSITIFTGEHECNESDGKATTSEAG